MLRLVSFLEMLFKDKWLSLLKGVSCEVLLRQRSRSFLCRAAENRNCCKKNHNLICMIIDFNRLSQFMRVDLIYFKLQHALLKKKHYPLLVRIRGCQNILIQIIRNCH